MDQDWGVLCRYRLNVVGKLDHNWQDLDETEARAQFEEFIQRNTGSFDPYCFTSFTDYFFRHRDWLAGVRNWHLDYSGRAKRIFFCHVSSHPLGVSNTQILCTAPFHMNCALGLTSQNEHVRALRQRKFIVNTTDAYIYEMHGTTIHRRQIAKRNGRRLFLRYYEE